MYLLIFLNRWGKSKILYCRFTAQICGGLQAFLTKNAKTKKPLNTRAKGMILPSLPMVKVFGLLSACQCLRTARFKGSNKNQVWHGKELQFEMAICINQMVRHAESSLADCQISLVHAHRTTDRPVQSPKMSRHHRSDLFNVLVSVLQC